MIASYLKYIKTKKNHSGSILISLIVTMVILSALGAAMLSLFSTSTMSQFLGNSSARAYYLAESGYRYASSEYSNAGGESAKNNMLESLHNADYTLYGDDGKFHLDIYPYYCITAEDTTPAPQTLLKTKVAGGFPPELTLPLQGYLKVAGETSLYNYVFQSGSSVNFTKATGNWKGTPIGVTVYPVSHSSSNRMVTNVIENNYIKLETYPGSYNAFPLVNGTFKIDGSINPNRIWCYKKRDGERLEGITPSDDPNGAFNLYIDTTYDIVLDKFVKLKSTGIVDSDSDLETKREITYHRPIFEESSGKVTYLETFEGGSLPGSFAGGAGEVGGHEVVDGALHVTTTGESSIDFNWRSTYVDLKSVWEDAVYLLSYDLQTKITVADQRYYMAGISFRKVSTASDTDLYGISYLRARQYWDSASGWMYNDNIPLGVKPNALLVAPLEYFNCWFSFCFGRYSQPAIVLWQRTSGTYKWLAYKILTSGDYVVGGTFNSKLQDWSNLQVRVIEAYPLTFSQVGLTTFLHGDTITIKSGATTIGTARVNGTPILASGSWDTGNAAGILTLSNVQLEEGMSIQLNDDLQVNGITRARASGTLGSKTNFIRAYYGDVDAHPDEGSFNYIPLDNIRDSNPRITDSGERVNWPVDNVSNWAADNDNLTLVQWNSDVDSSVTRLGGTGTKEENAIIQTDALTSPPKEAEDDWETRPEIALHTFGYTSLSIYFDDFAIQAENRTEAKSLPVIQQ